MAGHLPFCCNSPKFGLDAPSTRLELADMVRVQRAHDSRVDQSFRNGRNHEEIDFCLCSGSCKLWRIGSIEPGQPGTQASTNGNADTATQTRKTPNSMRGNDIGRKYRISNRQCEWLTEFPPDDDDWSLRSGVKDRIHS